VELVFVVYNSPWVRWIAALIAATVLLVLSVAQGRIDNLRKRASSSPARPNPWERTYVRPRAAGSQRRLPLRRTGAAAALIPKPTTPRLGRLLVLVGGLYALARLSQRPEAEAA
jgi:hypothetical protein